MAADPDVFIAGEDVGAYGGVFHTFDGLQAEFGERRAVDTPISEQAIIGLGIGAAVTGLRPIVDLMFMDFMLRGRRPDRQPGGQAQVHVRRRRQACR